MYELKQIGKVFTSKFVGTGPSCYKKRIYRAAVSQMLRNAAVDKNSGPLNFRRGGTSNNHGNFNFKNLFVRHFTTGVAS
jgi:hypothetical protein